MAHVITDACEKCVACVDACPNDSIHPKKDEAGFEGVAQLFINPDECIDCGACVPACPSNAIFPAEELPADKQQAAEANAAHFKQ